MVVGPPGQESAGIYRMTPENMEGGYYRSTRFRPGSTISFISVASESDGAAAAEESAKASEAEALRPALAQVKGNTEIPVLLPERSAGDVGR